MKFVFLLSLVVLGPGLNTTAAAQTAAQNVVTAHGAAGDGQADDSAAIQRAVDAGGTVRFPPGNYRLTRTVVIELDKTGFTSLCGDGTARVIMAGAGPAFRIVGTHGGSANPATFKPDVWERQRSPMVDGIEIVGAHEEADGIQAAGTMQLTITRTTVREARHGIHLVGRNRNVIISDCHLYHNRGVGVYYDHVDLHQSNIIGSHISYNGGGGVVSRGGGVRNLQIGTCDIEGNMDPDGPPTANVLIDCSEGSTAEVTIVGCTLQHFPAPGSANIRFIGKGKPLGEDDNTQWGHLTIGDNVLTDAHYNIHLQHVRGVTITGNSIGSAYTLDVLIEDSGNIAIGANVLDRNPRYFTGRNAAAKGGVVFRNSHDCTLTGLHINGARQAEAALLLEDCDSFNITGCTILDSDGAGLLLKNTRHSLVTGNLIRDRRPDREKAPAIKVEGGGDNTLAGNKTGTAE